MRKLFIIAALVLGAASAPTLLSSAAAQDVTVPTQAQAKASTGTSEVKNSWYGQQVALSGHDVVSFRSETGPVAGTGDFTAQWDNTDWHFASEENRDTFLENPEHYAPQFGGYCPVALAEGEAKVGLAEQFTVVDEKLYLNYNKRTNTQFQENTTGYIAAAKLNF